MKKVLTIALFLTFAGCSNLSINRRAWQISPPDPNGYSEVTGRIEFRDAPVNVVQYEITNTSTKEKSAGEVKMPAALVQQIKAIEGDTLHIRLRDDKGNSTYDYFTVPPIPQLDKLKRMGYSHEEALAYMDHLAKVEYQQQLIRAQQIAAAAQMFGAILAASAAQQPRTVIGGGYSNPQYDAGQIQIQQQLQQIQFNQMRDWQYQQQHRQW